MKAYEVLKNVNTMIESAEAYKAHYGWAKRWQIGHVCEDLGIFDWWNEWLSVSQLKQMKKFLEVAIERGFDGYVCFKVGAAGCSHGMWANECDSTDGYSPKEGACLYHSFRSGDNYYDLRRRDGSWVHEDMKLKDVDAELANAFAVGTVEGRA